MIIRFFDLDLVFENNEGVGTSNDWIVVILGFIVVCLWLNWLYTLLVLGVLTIVVGSLMFDKSFNAIEKEIKEKNNGNK